MGERLLLLLAAGQRIDLREGTGAESPAERPFGQSTEEAEGLSRDSGSRVREEGMHHVCVLLSREVSNTLFVKGFGDSAVWPEVGHCDGDYGSVLRKVYEVPRAELGSCSE